MTQKSYAEKLKDPRWQKKRLEVLNRDDFTCRLCGSKDKTLHIHHLWYEYGREPWDYHIGYLATLCEACHELETKNLKTAIADLRMYMALSDYFSADIHSLIMILGCIREGYIGMSVPDGIEALTFFARPALLKAIRQGMEKSKWANRELPGPMSGCEIPPCELTLRDVIDWGKLAS